MVSIQHAVRRIHPATLSASLLAFFIAVSLSNPATAVTRNGFELDGASVPADEILRGGPPRDGIPAIDKPQFLQAGKTKTLQANDRILGVVVDGIAKAYPVAIMNWHELVNDHFGDKRVLVTYCPLCGTGMAFSPKIDGQEHLFGVSGLLYNNDVLLYDRESESLWSQVIGTSIAGAMKGKKLTPLVTANTSWSDWQARYPDTLVLSEQTGFTRNYKRNPYLGYDTSDRVLFKMRLSSGRYHPKESVLGVSLDGHYKAWPYVELRKNGKARFNDSVAGQTITVVYDDANASARILDAQGKEMPAIKAFWFAWYAFHPDGEVFEAAPGKGSKS